MRHARPKNRRIKGTRAMQERHAQAWKGTLSVLVCVLCSATSDAEPATGKRAELVGLGEVLYSPPIAAPMATCVQSTETKRSSEIRGQVKEAASLPTKSHQQEALRKLVEEQRLVPMKARADCMTTAVMYLVFVTGGESADASGFADLSESGLGDLSLLLENHSRGTVVQCGPWVTAGQFRKYVPSEQACEAWLHRTVENEPYTAMKLVSYSTIFGSASSDILSALQDCFRGETIEVAPGVDAEAEWTASCRLAEMTGLSISGVRQPDLSRQALELQQFKEQQSALEQQRTRDHRRVLDQQRVLDQKTLQDQKRFEELRGANVTPPSTQGKGARITQPKYPPASRRAGEEGAVALWVNVLADGIPGEVEVSKSSGFPHLDESAVKEVRQNWRFVPGMKAGVPTPMWHYITLTFRVTN